ncbi:MAG: type VI secretion system lipoprotein TssJ, partial [Ignavibacteriae bacterium]
GIQTINIDLISDVNANGGNAVVIKIYQLTNDDKFRLADFKSLWKKAEETLANEFIPPFIEETIVPNKNYELKEIEISKEAAFVGVVGDFHSPSKDGWRLIISVDSDIDYLKILILENSLSLQKE